MTTTEDELRAERARRRRASYSVEVVRGFPPKPALYGDLPPLERLRRMSLLCRRQWESSGQRLPAVPRREWPVEVFDTGRG